MTAGPPWRRFAAIVVVLAAIVVVFMYRAEQGHLTEVRDECVAAAPTLAATLACQQDYETNSGWF